MPNYTMKQLSAPSLTAQIKPVLHEAGKEDAHTTQLCNPRKHTCYKTLIVAPLPGRNRPTGDHAGCALASAAHIAGDLCVYRGKQRFN